MKSRYTTLLFDADNTLLDFSKAERMSLIKTMEHFSVPVTEENIRKYVEINQGLWKQIEKKEITKLELKKIRFRRFFESIDFKTDAEILEVNEYYLGNLSDCGYTVEGAQELCRKLRGEGYDIHIVTNGIADTQARRLSKSGLSDYIGKVFVSEAIGYPKPMKEFFDYVLKALPQKDKSKIIVIGDSLSSDILGAANAGLDCIWLNAENTALPEGYRVDYTVNSLKELENIFL